VNRHCAISLLFELYIVTDDIICVVC
jgi:hypothetical protein